MDTFTYNDIVFHLNDMGATWDLEREVPGAGRALVGAGLYPGASSAEAGLRARSLARSIFPVGVRIVGPDVDHGTRVGDLRLVMPDVSHPNFIRWEKDSVSLSGDTGSY